MLCPFFFSSYQFSDCFVFNNISALLDIALSWKARHSMSHYVKLRYVLKAGAAAGWVIVMPVAYAYSLKNASGFALTIKNWFGGHGHNSPSLFIVAILIYLSPNMLSALLFLFPFIRRYLERSDFKIMMLMMWWSQVPTLSMCLLSWLNVCIEPKRYDLSWLLVIQPRLYIGRGMHESALSLFK